MRSFLVCTVLVLATVVSPAFAADTCCPVGSTYDGHDTRIVAHYRLNGDLTDATTGTHDLTRSGGSAFTYVEGVSGNCEALDLTGGGVAIATNQAAVPVGQVARTLILYVKYTSTPGSGYQIFAGYGDYTSAGGSFFVGWDGSHIYFSGNGNTGDFPVSDFSLTVNQWIQVAATYDGTTTTLYLNDGISKKSASFSGTGLNTASNPSFVIGGFPSGANAFSKGQIGDVVVYNTALTSTEIDALFAASNNGIGSCTTPPTSFPFTRCTATFHCPLPASGAPESAGTSVSASFSYEKFTISAVEDKNSYNAIFEVLTSTATDEVSAHQLVDGGATTVTVTASLGGGCSFSDGAALDWGETVDGCLFIHSSSHHEN